MRGHSGRNEIPAFEGLQEPKSGPAIIGHGLHCRMREYVKECRGMPPAVVGLDRLSESSLENSSDPLSSHCDFDMHSFVLIAAGILGAPLEVVIFGENTHKIQFVVSFSQSRRLASEGRILSAAAVLAVSRGLDMRQAIATDRHQGLPHGAYAVGLVPGSPHIPITVRNGSTYSTVQNNWILAYF
ncbi:hypothetical protein BS47DRAFT_1090054 [Hydnum rufescens UP504]|uniref:Uncharacterized protein n=1 Tax=Hydnum rufescens UP504 TaxID=1448309 RepID=A0A9P6AUM0_9AGAM|nr:hypothetical protein BS47DRAFT_1090054 [Hydnum rufescens UP504]